VLTRRTYSLALVLSLSVLLLSAPAPAQRGFSSEEPVPLKNESAGFPGFHDTYLVNKGEYVSDLGSLIYFVVPIPSVTLDYGLTDTTTIGTNIPLSIFPWSVGGYGGSFKTRTLFYGTPRWQSTLTWYGAYFGASTDAQQILFYYNMLTSNTAYVLDERNILTAQLGYFGLAGSQTPTNNAELASTAEVSTSFLGANLEHVYSPTTSFHTSLVLPLYLDMNVDTPGSSTTLGMVSGTVATSFLYGKFAADFRINPDWVITTGLAMFSVPAQTLETVPWLGAQVRW
jgi:hypothetical protein